MRENCCLVDSSREMVSAIQAVQRGGNVWNRRCVCVGILVIAVMASLAPAEAQLIGDGFDGYVSGQPPPWPWWNWGASGMRNVDDTVFLGPSGKSVNFTRTVFDGNPFAIGQSFWPVFGEATIELSYFFRVPTVGHETLSAFGRHNDSNQIAWWVTVGGDSWNGVVTFSDSQGWTQIMSVSPDTWYGVHIVADIPEHSYDISVWEEANPANSVTVTGLDFRNGASANAVDQIQFGDFNADVTPYSGSSYLDSVFFIGPIVFVDGFESGDTNAWSSVSP